MPKNDPSQRDSAAWSWAPPAPLDHPALYESLVSRRALAYLLDVLILVALAAAIWFTLGVFTLLTFGLLGPLQVFALALLPFAYHTAFIGALGQTLGMRACDVEVRAWSGERPDYLRAFLMTALFYLSIGLATFLILLVALFNDRRRTLHDFLAGTLCVRQSHLAAILP